MSSEIAGFLGEMRGNSQNLTWACLLGANLETEEGGRRKALIMGFMPKASHVATMITTERSEIVRWSKSRIRLRSPQAKMWPQFGSCMHLMYTADT